MESNGGQQRRSTKPSVAKEGTQSGRVEGGGEAVSVEESAGDVPKKVKKFERIFVKASRTYSGEKVMEMLNKLRYKLAVERAKSRSLLKTNKNMRDRNMKKMQKHIKKASILKLRNNGLAKNYRVMMAKWEEKLKKEKDKREKFQKEEIKKMRKSEWNRAKYYWEIPNDKTNPRNYDIITWTRIYAKLGLVRKRTKLKNTEIILLLWISAHQEGDATSRKWTEDTGISIPSILKFSKRLIQFNLMRITKVGSRNRYDLTERGRQFVEPIIAFVKKEHQHAKKRKRKFVRNPVLPAETTGSVHDGEL
jgi:predicted transcriptional regulator